MPTLYDQILCFGDSITQRGWEPFEFGWGAALQNEYQRKLDVVGRGFSGFTTEHAKLLLPLVVPRTKSENEAKVILFILFFGANDATLKDESQHVPLDTYASNLREILTSPVLKQHNPDMKFLLIGPPPICEYSREDSGRARGRTAEHTSFYATKAKAVADELGVPFVDLWTGFLTAVGWKPGDPLTGSKSLARNLRLGELIPDGLHFSGEGNRLCFQLVFQKIKEAYPELNPEKMEMKIPAWDADDVFAKIKHAAEDLG